MGVRCALFARIVHAEEPSASEWAREHYGYVETVFR
jgi:hypothetical protein